MKKFKLSVKITFKFFKHMCALMISFNILFQISYSQTLYNFQYKNNLSYHENLSEELSSSILYSLITQKQLSQDVIKAYNRNNFMPVWVNLNGLNDKAREVLKILNTADQYGLRNTDYAMPALSKVPSLNELSEFEVLFTEKILRYALHAYQGRIEPIKIHANFTPDRPILDSEEELRVLLEAKNPEIILLQYHPKHAGFLELKNILNLMMQSNRSETKDSTVKKLPSNITNIDIIANMERWRWLPRDLGSSYIWSNIPSYMVQIIQDRHVFFETRSVVGTVKTPTPVFSDVMDHIVVNPTWTVPSSIASKEYLPLLKKDARALARKGIEVVSLSNGKVLDPDLINWSNVNEKMPFIFRQPPSEQNALGNIKFMFPNSHAVYMHDTPSKKYFNYEFRAQSHGCVRLADPILFADAIFKNDSQWDGRKIAELIGKKERRIDLKVPINVHIVYFTIAAKNGDAIVYEDTYGFNETHKYLLEK